MKALPVPGRGAATDINNRDEVLAHGDGGGYLVKAGQTYLLDDLLIASNPLSACVHLGSGVINDKGVIVTAGANSCTGTTNFYLLTPKTN